jgi:hypothetical protein
MTRQEASSVSFFFFLLLGCVTLEEVYYKKTIVMPRMRLVAAKEEINAIHEAIVIVRHHEPFSGV